MKNELTPLEMFEIITKNLKEDATSDLPVALEQLDKYITFYAYCVKNKISINDLEKLSDDYVAVSKKEYEYIETALKKLEQIEKNQTIFENNPITVGNKIMALEIIKKLPEEEKQIILNAVYTYASSEEEYNLLLKEIL